MGQKQLNQNLHIPEMDKAFRFLHKGAILNVKWCKTI
jgi:hypothetical protein